MLNIYLPGNVSFIVYKWRSSARREKGAGIGRKAAFYFPAYAHTELYSSHYCHRTGTASFTCFGGRAFLSPQ